MIFGIGISSSPHDVLCAMGRINPLDTFLFLAWILRVFGQKLLNGVAIGVGGGGGVGGINHHQEDKSFIHSCHLSAKDIFFGIIFCLLVSSI